MRDAPHLLPLLGAMPTEPTDHAVAEVLGAAHARRWRNRQFPGQREAEHHLDQARRALADLEPCVMPSAMVRGPVLEIRAAPPAKPDGPDHVIIPDAHLTVEQFDVWSSHTMRTLKLVRKLAHRPSAPGQPLRHRLAVTSCEALPLLGPDILISDAMIQYAATIPALGIYATHILRAARCFPLVVFWGKALDILERLAPAEEFAQAAGDLQINDQTDDRDLRLRSAIRHSADSVHTWFWSVHPCTTHRLGSAAFRNRQLAERLIDQHASLLEGDDDDHHLLLLGVRRLARVQTPSPAAGSGRQSRLTTFRSLLARMDQALPRAMSVPVLRRLAHEPLHHLSQQRMLENSAWMHKLVQAMAVSLDGLGTYAQLLLVKLVSESSAATLLRYVTETGMPSN